jgi:HAD superfamily hydrolase (TIGR01509 family)
VGETTGDVSSPIELVIFECDGVLVDSERLAIKIDAMMLASLGWPLSEEEIVRRFVGRSDAYMRSEIEAHLGASLPVGWADQWGPAYRKSFENELTPVDGIAEALNAIALPMCVASSTSPEGVRWRLELTGLIDRFRDDIFSSTQVANGKPAPDLFLFAAERMGFAPDVCAVVEDSAWGVEAAHAAGMRVLAYAGGVTGAGALAGDGTIVFDDMRELPSLLG